MFVLRKKFQFIVRVKIMSKYYCLSGSMGSYQGEGAMDVCVSVLSYKEATKVMFNDAKRWMEQAGEFSEDTGSSFSFRYEGMGLAVFLAWRTLFWGGVAENDYCIFADLVLLEPGGLGVGGSPDFGGYVSAERAGVL